MAPNADNRRVLATNLTTLLGERGFGQYELARVSGVSQRTINDIINQRVSTTIDVVSKLARALDIETWDLLRPKDEVA
jgi:plasmid maintenance system antidote protein VapI